MPTTLLPSHSTGTSCGPGSAGERIVSSLQTIADLRAQLRSALARLGQTLDS